MLVLMYLEIFNEYYYTLPLRKVSLPVCLSLVHAPDLFFFREMWKALLSRHLPLWTSRLVAMLTAASLAASIPRVHLSE